MLLYFRYELSLNFYDKDSSTLANHYANINHMAFSTKDRDQDGDGRWDCSNEKAGSTGWWFDGSYCFMHGGLNGINKERYTGTKNGKPAYGDCIWAHTCLRESTMTIRRVSERCT